MNQVEDRLRTAAAETRRLATRQRLAAVHSRHTTRGRGWPILAASFAIVVVLFGVLPLLLDTSSVEQPLGSTPVIENPQTTTSQPETSCSATTARSNDLRGLPEAVASTRIALIAAALECDFDALDAFADDSFVTSFGGGGVENLRTWESAGDGQMDTLLKILSMSYGTIDTGEEVLFVWPAAHTYESWDEIPDEAVTELRLIYSLQDLENMNKAGAYIGWRTAIDSEGRWRFFVAGD